MCILNQYEKHCFNPLTDEAKTLPNKMGLYMICIKDKDKDNLPVTMKDVIFREIEGLPLILYIGISAKQGLRKRDYRNHFAGTARNSTLRKSLGSLFKWKSDRYEHKDGKYKFNKDREDQLSEWMHKNLLMFYWIIDGNVSDLEKVLINEISPPLNLGKNKSLINYEFRKSLSYLRS